MPLNNGRKGASRSSRSTTSSRRSRFEISDEIFNNAPEDDSSDDEGPWIVHNITSHHLTSHAHVGHGTSRNDNGGSLLSRFGGGGRNGEEYPFSSDDEGEDHDKGSSVGSRSLIESTRRSVKQVVSKFCTFIYMSLMWVIYLEKWCLSSRQDSNSHSNAEDTSSNEDLANGHVYTNEYQYQKMSGHQYHVQADESHSEVTQTQSSIFGFFRSMFRSSSGTVVVNNHQGYEEAKDEDRQSFVSRTGSIMESWLATLKNVMKYFWNFCRLLFCLLLVILLIYLLWANGSMWYAKMASSLSHMTRVEPKMEAKVDSSGMQTYNQHLHDINIELNELISRLKRVESEVENQKSAPKQVVDPNKLVESMLPSLRSEIEEKVALTFASQKCPDPPSFEGLTAEQTEQLIKSALSKIDANLAAIEQKVTLDCGSQKCPDHSAFIGLSAEEIEVMIKRAISRYDADKTGLPDLALESAGGSILSTRCTKSSDSRNSVISYWGFRLWSPPNSPRTIIQPGAVPGECWAFEGSVGDVVIKLAVPALVTGFTLEHIPKTVSRYNNIDSAPKNFQVLGLQSEHDTIEVHDYGTFTFEDSNAPLQFFEVANATSKYYPIVELKILSNHGNMKHTCIYRFRVHGYIDLERSHGGGKPRNVNEDDKK